MTTHTAPTHPSDPAPPTPTEPIPAGPDSEIPVRRPRWRFPDDLTDVFPGPDLSEDCSRVALSLTLPHLEPYLIRTLRGAVEAIDDARLAADVRAFCAQEAQHHRNHALANAAIRRALGDRTGRRLLKVEEQLEADYRRFSRERPRRFNLAYAEGFEAMTCAIAITRMTQPPPTGPFGPWQQLWTWHLAEEVEHRTVAFEAFEHLVGSYPYRVATGLAAQLHFLSYLDRFHAILMRHHGRRPVRPHVPKLLRSGWRRYVATFSPRYDPAHIEPPTALTAFLRSLDQAVPDDTVPTVPATG